MDVIKAHVFCTIILTQLTALWVDGDLPYFPIEISATAASAYASTIFQTGILSCIAVMAVFKALRTDTVALWVALSVIAVFDDVKFWWTHLAGVFLLMLVSGYAAVRAGPSSLAPFVAAGLVYVGRLVLKIGVILIFEKLPTARSFHELFLVVVNHHQAIMYQGAVACTNPRAVMPVMQFCGVLQWAVLYELSHIFY